MWDIYAPFRRSTLTNGLSLHCNHMRDRPWQMFNFIVHAGAGNDPVGREGLAHFLEHVSNHHCGMPHEDLESMIEREGGRPMFGMTSFVATQYGCFVPLGMVQASVDAFGSLVLGSELTDGVEHERAVIEQEFRRTYSRPFDLDLRMARHRALFPGSPLSRMPDASGTLASIAAISIDDLRSFRRMFCVPQNISVVAIGGMDEQRVTQVLERSAFGLSMQGAATPLPAIDRTYATSAGQRLEYSAAEYPGEMPPTDTPGYMTYAKIPGDINSHALGIYANMLRKVLTREIRTNRRWTYSIDCALDTFISFKQLQICCDSFAPEATHSFERVVEECIDSVGDDRGLFEDIAGRHLTAVRMDDSNVFELSETASGMIAHYGEIRTDARSEAEIRAVTMDDIRRVHEALRPERRWSVLVRP